MILMNNDYDHDHEKTSDDVRLLIQLARAHFNDRDYKTAATLFEKMAALMRELDAKKKETTKNAD